jgi:hypothetical protein
MLKRTVTKTKYGLYHKEKKRLLTYDIEHHNRDFSTGTIVTLNKDESNNIWLVEDKINAEYVRNFSTPWYNSCLERPTHRFKPEELITVKVEIVEKIEPIDVKIPTVEEYIKEKYDNPRDKYHYDHLLEILKKGTPPLQYSWYDLYFLLEEREKKKRKGEPSENKS